MEVLDLNELNFIVSLLPDWNDDFDSLLSIDLFDLLLDLDDLNDDLDSLLLVYLFDLIETLLLTITF